MNKSEYGRSNGYGKLIYRATGWCPVFLFRHREDNNSSTQVEIEYYDVNAGDTLIPRLSFSYDQDKRNYWHVRFKNGGSYYSIDNNFYCSFSQSDKDKTARVTIESLSNLKVEFQNSSSCNKTINRE